jgi:hypothetical protein
MRELPRERELPNGKQIKTERDAEIVTVRIYVRSVEENEN